MTQPLAPSRVLVPLGLAVCLSLFGDLTLYAVLVTQLDVVGLSLGAVGVMLGVNRLVRIPGNPLAGLLFDRWGRRWMFILGMLLGVLSTASYSLVHGFFPFLVSRMTWGIAWTLINVGGLSMVLDVSTPANRGRLTGLYNTWLLAGFAIGPLAGGFLVDLVGFRLGLLACAGFTAVGLAVAVVALPETAGPAGQGTQSQPQPSLSLRRRLRATWHQRVSTVLQDRNLMTASVLFLITMFAGDGVILSTVSLLLQERFGQTVSMGSLALGVASAGGVLIALRSVLAGVVGPLAGHLSDVHLGRWPVIGGGLLLGMVGFGLLAFATSPAAILLAVALGAVSSGAALATLIAYAGDLTPQGSEGAVMGVYATAGDIGSMAGPFVAFALAALVGLRWVYLLSALMFLAGLWLLWRTRGVRNPGMVQIGRKPP